MPLGMEVGVGPGNFVFDGNQATPRKKRAPTATQFLSHVYCAHGRPSQLGPTAELLLQGSWS